MENDTKTDYYHHPTAESVMDDISMLQEVAETHGVDSVYFREKLDEAAFSYVLSNFGAEYSENLRTIRDKSTSRHNKELAVASNRELVERAKHAIINETGIEGVEADELTASRKYIEDIISKDVELRGKASRPLEALGILIKDKDGNERYYYPRSLFPHSTNELWHEYTKVVKRHVDLADRLSKNNSNSSIGHGQVVELDRARRIAHDRLAKDIQFLLGLPDNDSGFQEARGLIEKMRDNRFPTVDTGERHRLQDRVLAGSGQVLALLAELENAGLLDDPERNHSRAQLY